MKGACYGVSTANNYLRGGSVITGSGGGGDGGGDDVSLRVCNLEQASQHQPTCFLGKGVIYI